ncbi:antistasin-like [Paramacrobiotus metropolitanus]|uniref:antistasin-like n=1 Tax=Paramacrobiotus metropolitanus TaxID=2943436 RepID=UPI002445BDD5|nr:antistasin-like [Paramacrobiotus metropolitanus]
MQSIAIISAILALAAVASGSVIADAVAGQQPRMCMIYCEHGFELNENGQQICKCRTAPTCAPVMCMIFCEHGFDTAENGCEVCRCKPQPQPTCPPAMCHFQCPHGFVHDANGCRTCRCQYMPPIHRPTLIPPFIDPEHLG